jgi:capsular exopolysaccharide synthesis family protein
METDLRTYVQILRRRGKLIAMVVVAVLAVAVAAMLARSPVYRATGLVEIRGNDDAVTSVDAMFSTEDPSDEHMRTNFGLLRSASLARRVIADVGLDTVPEFVAPGLLARALGLLSSTAPAPEPAGNGVPAVPRELVDRFLDRLIVDPVESSRLVRVNFEAEDPALAARVVNSLIENYTEWRVSDRVEAASRIQVQLDSTRQQLQRSEEELRQYADANGLPFSVDADAATQVQEHLRELQAQLVEVQGARYEKESLYNAVVQDGRADAGEDAVLSSLLVELGDLKQQYARLSQTFTDDYPEVAEVKRQIAAVEAQIDGERQRLARGVEDEYRASVQRENLLQDEIARQKQLASELGPKAGTYHVLRQAVLSNRDMYSTLQAKKREAEVTAAIGATDLGVVDRAEPPLEPHTPVYKMSLALALMLAMVLGVGVAFLREYTDDRVYTVEDIDGASGLPILAMIPSLEHAESRWALPGRANGAGVGRSLANGRRRRPHERAEDRRNAAALSDAFGTLRTAVLFTEGQATPTSILVTSCRAGEGKTTVSVNLAVSLAKLGNRVLLVDGDLRRPSLHRVLSTPRSPGLAHYLRDGRSWQEMVHRSEAHGLEVLPSGGPSSAAGDLLSGGGMQKLLELANRLYDFVIVDAPALFINASDARIVSRIVDGVVVVVRSRETPRSLVNRVPGAIPNLIGVVVNDLQSGNLPEYFRQYFEDYSALEEDEIEDIGVVGAR